MKCTFCNKRHKDIDCPIIKKISKNLKDDIDRDLTERIIKDENIHEKGE